MPARSDPDSLPPYVPPDTPPRQQRDAIRRLEAGKERWARMPPARRLAMLRTCLSGLELEARDWVRAACRARGHRLGSAGEGEEWLSGPVTVIRYLRQLIAAYERPPKRAPNATTTVFPGGRRRQLLIPGLKAEVQGGVWPVKHPQEGQVRLLLSGSGPSALPALDALHALFIEGAVVLLKISPHAAFAGPYISRAFWRLIEEGFFTILYGGADVGASLLAETGIDAVHLTGAAATAEIVRAATRLPLTAALGNVTPVIAAPGRWSSDTIRHQGRSVASMVAHTAGAHCASAQVLVLPAGWGQKEELLASVEEHLRRLPPRRPWHPDARRRWERLAGYYPAAQLLGSEEGGAIPWTLIPKVPAQPGEPALREESLCGLLAIVELPSEGFLPAAVDLCNRHVYGSLCCALLADEDGLADPALEKAIEDLRYGTVAVNAWPGAAFELGLTPWGAAPGDTDSGWGFTHNSALVPDPSKSVLRAPPVLKPTPPWLADHPRLAELGPALAEFEAEPRWRALPKLAAVALRG